MFAQSLTALVNGDALLEFDIAALKAADLICYVGSPRKGRYRKTTG